MDDHLCLVSLDTVALSAVAEPPDDIQHLVEHLGGLPSQIILSSYAYNYRLSDGTRVAWGYLGADPGRVYIYLSPSKTQFALLSRLLCLLRNVGVRRCDIAIDYLGCSVQDYEFHCSRLGLSRHMLARNEFPHSLTLGEGSSHRRLAIYDKLEKCRADHIREARVVDVHGAVHRIPISGHVQDDRGWLRVEARLRGRWLLDDAIPRPGAFDDLIAIRRGGALLGLDVRTEATLEYISRNPEAIRRLSRNSRSKYRAYQRQLRELQGLIPDPADVYRDNYVAICEALERIRTLGSAPEGGNE